MVWAGVDLFGMIIMAYAWQAKPRPKMYLFCSIADHLSWIGRLEGTFFLVQADRLKCRYEDEDIPKEQCNQGQQYFQSYTDSFNSV